MMKLPKLPKTAKYVIREGKVVSGSAAVANEATKVERIGYIDPDDLKRYQRLVRRMHFLDRD